MCKILLAQCPTDQAVIIILDTLVWELSHFIEEQTVQSN